MWEVDVRIIGVEMKFCNTYRTGNGEGKPLCIHTYDKFILMINLYLKYYN